MIGAFLVVESGDAFTRLLAEISLTAFAAAATARGLAGTSASLRPDVLSARPESATNAIFREQPSRTEQP